MNTFSNMVITDCSKLNAKICKALLASGCYAASSQTEYCEFALRARLAELATKAAVKKARAQDKIEKTTPPPSDFLSNDFPPAMVNSFATQTVVAALMKVKKPLFAIGKKLGFTFSKSLEQLENNVVTTTYKFEVKF